MMCSDVPLGAVFPVQVLKEMYIFPYIFNHFDLWFNFVLGRLHRGSMRILLQMALGAKERR